MVWKDFKTNCIFFGFPGCGPAPDSTLTLQRRKTTLPWNTLDLQLVDDVNTFLLHACSYFDFHVSDANFTFLEHAFRNLFFVFVLKL